MTRKRHQHRNQQSLRPDLELGVNSLDGKNRIIKLERIFLNLAADLPRNSILSHRRTVFVRELLTLLRGYGFEFRKHSLDINLIHLVGKVLS